jgi:hypothetical protein
MDIVKRLRRWSPEESTHELHEDAANEIERLRDDLKHSDEVRQSALQSLLSAENEIERLVNTLQQITKMPDYNVPNHRDVARDALGEKE